MIPVVNRIYARWLDIGTHFGLLVLSACFLIYVLAILEPFVGLDVLPSVWHLPVDRYVETTGAPTGWGWAHALDKGDYLNLIGVAALTTVTLVCYARVIPTFFRNGQRLQAAFAIAQVIVLVAAATGWLAGAH